MSVLKLDYKKNPKDFNKILDEAFESLGFLVVTNYEAINKDMIDAAYQESKDFFALTENVKIKYSNENEGYVPFGKEHAKDSNLYDLKEFFHILDKNRKAFKSHTFPNIYKLMDALNTLSQQLLKYCDINMESPSITTLSNSTFNGNSVLRMLHYPPIEENTNHLRAAPHEDINLITLLISATNPGLQVKSNGKWLDVDCEPNQIIVNVGDMLQSYSNGYYKSTTHQVINTETNTSRYSMPYFVHPRSEFNISPRSQMITKIGHSNFPKLTAGEYLNIRLKEIGLK
jgi:isopenicillin N synthase-like dioxygenase